MTSETETSLDSREPLLESGLAAEKSTIRIRKAWFIPETHTIHLALLVFAGIGLFGVGIVVGRSTTCGATQVPLSSRPGSGLPWRDSLNKLTGKYTRFDGSLYPQSLNKYRGPPGKEVDEAWDRFTTNPWMVETAAVLNVSAQEAALSMNDGQIDTVVNLGDDNGGGYMGTIEMFHQLHCLNLLRKWTYVEHYGAVDPFWTMKNSHRREHTDHCIDMVRQALMCNADTGLILFHWIKGMPVPSPNFHTMHQCLEPEAVLQWAKQEAAPIKRKIEKPNGVKELEHFF